MSDNSLIYIFQKGFNYSQDGPGNRLVYHLSGCNMFCPWCSNPEGLKRSDNATALSSEDILKESLSSKMIFIDGGGVTFTGGEVTCQKDAVLHTIRLLKANGISTCIETNASLPDCEDLFEEVDYMIADFKSPDRDRLKSITGGDLDVIKKNLLFRIKTGKPLLIRIPLIHFFNCGEEAFKKFAETFGELNKENKNDNLFLEILTYHEFGKEKYKEINKEYAVTDGFVRDSDVKSIVAEFKNKNLKLIKT